MYGSIIDRFRREVEQKHGGLTSECTCAAFLMFIHATPAERQRFIEAIALAPARRQRTEGIMETALRIVGEKRTK